MDRAELHAAIGLGAILFLFLLALGFLCSNRTKRQRERDVEQEQWEQEEDVLGHRRVMYWERTDRSSCLTRSRADSATSSLFGAEDRGKRDQPGYRGASQQRSSTTEQCSTAASAMGQLGHHQPSERPLPTLSEAITWQEQNLYPSMPHHSNHWRQSSMHSIANRLSFRQPSLSKTRYGRQCAIRWRQRVLSGISLHLQLSWNRRLRCMLCP